MRKYCTLVGSRKTPDSILKLMEKIGYKLYQEGFIARSGDAIGADRAFVKKIPPGEKVVYTPKNFDFSKENYDFCWNEITSVMDSHLKLENYTKYCQILLMRNVNQVLGSRKTNDFMVKSDFLICWTPHTNYSKSDVGGTRFAVRIALKYQIPVFNLVRDDHQKRLENWLFTRE